MMDNPQTNDDHALTSLRGLSRARSGAEAPATRRILRGGGVFFGLAYALTFALLVWVRDGFLLARSNAEWPWLDAAAGLPPALLFGGLSGWLASLVASPGWSVAVWIPASAALGWVAAHVPCEGATLIAGWLEPRVAGLGLIPFTPYHATSTWVVMGGLALVGLAVGLAQPYVVEAFWDRLGAHARERYRGPRLWFSPAAIPLLFFAALLAVPSALIVISMFSTYRTAPSRQVDRLVQAALAGGEAQVRAEGLDPYPARRYGARFTPTYEHHIHHPYRSTDSVHTIYVDTAFDNGFVMRCSVVGGELSFCDDISQLYPVWMDSLVAGGRAGTQPWLDLPQQLRVEPGAEAALAQGRDALAGDYTVERALQRGGIVWLDARFTSGAVLTCRFRGLYPTAVDACDLR